MTAKVISTSSFIVPALESLDEIEETVREELEEGELKWADESSTAVALVLLSRITEALEHIALNIGKA